MGRRSAPAPSFTDHSRRSAAEAGVRAAGRLQPRCRTRGNGRAAPGGCGRASGTAGPARHAITASAGATRPTRSRSPSTPARPRPTPRTRPGPTLTGTPPIASVPPPSGPAGTFLAVGPPCCCEFITFMAASAVTSPTASSTSTGRTDGCFVPSGPRHPLRQRAAKGPRPAASPRGHTSVSIPSGLARCRPKPAASASATSAANARLVNAMPGSPSRRLRISRISRVPAPPARQRQLRHQHVEPAATADADRLVGGRGGRGNRWPASPNRTRPSPRVGVAVDDQESIRPSLDGFPPQGIGSPRLCPAINCTFKDFTTRRV